MSITVVGVVEGVATGAAIALPAGVTAGDTLYLHAQGVKGIATPAGWVDVNTSDTAAKRHAFAAIRTYAAGQSGPVLPSGTDYVLAAFRSVYLLDSSQGDHPAWTLYRTVVRNMPSGLGGVGEDLLVWSIVTPSAVTLQSLPSGMTAQTTDDQHQLYTRTITTGEPPSESVQLFSGIYQSAWDSALLLRAIAAPAAPTPLTPESGAVIDGSQAVAFTLAYNSVDGADQRAYSLGIRVVGAAWSWWNAATQSLQSGQILNPAVVTPDGLWTVLVPAGALPNGSDWQWQALSQEDAGGLSGPLSDVATFSTRTPPTVTVTAPAGPVTTTTTPDVVFSTTAAAGSSVTAARVLVYDEDAYSRPGFQVGVSTPAYDSGQIAPVSPVHIATALANGADYRVYAQATATGGQLSAWATSDFTIVLDGPHAPDVTASPSIDADTGAPVIAVTVTSRDNLLDLQTSSLEAAGTGSWTAGSATSISRAAPGLDGGESLTLTTTAAGTASAAAVVAAGPGQYAAVASFLAASAGRQATVRLDFVDGSAAVLATATSPPVSDIAWQQASVIATAPAGTVSARLTVSVLGCGSGESHHVDQAGIAPGDSTDWARGGLSGLSTAVVEYSDDGVTWFPLRAGAVMLTASASVVYDAEVAFGAQRSYRAHLSTLSGADVLTSPYSAVEITSVDSASYWLSDPYDPSTAMLARVHVAADTTRTRAQAVFAALGREDEIVVSGVRRLRHGGLTVLATDGAIRAQLDALIEAGVVLCLRAPPDPGAASGDVIYLRLGPVDTVTRLVQGPSALRDVALTWIEQPRPED